MATAGPNSAGTSVTSATGSASAWSSGGNITASDNSYVTNPLSDGTTQRLVATGFSFSIPSGATIQGILVEWEMKGSVSNNAIVSEVFMVKASSIQTGASNLSDTYHLTTTDAVRSYGGSSSLWGNSWAYTDINDSGFGSSLRLDNNGGGGNISVDHCRITITYSVVVAADLVFGTVTGQSSATLLVKSPTALSLSSAVGVATAAAVVSAPARATIVPATADGVATATLAVQSPHKLALSAVAGVSTATILVKSPALLSMTAAGIATAILAVKSPALLTLTAAGVAVATISAITIPTSGSLSLQTTAGVATASLALRANTLLALSVAAGIATATLNPLGSPALLTLGAVPGSSTAALVVISPALLSILADGLAGATLTVSAPSVAFLTMAADGIAGASLAVKSPAKLSMRADGLAGGTLAVSSPVYLALTAAGLSSAQIFITTRLLRAIMRGGTVTLTNQRGATTTFTKTPSGIVVLSGKMGAGFTS